jgi:hypothetical protein
MLCFAAGDKSGCLVFLPRALLRRWHPRVRILFSVSAVVVALAPALLWRWGVCTGAGPGWLRRRWIGRRCDLLGWLALVAGGPGFIPRRRRWVVLGPELDDRLGARPRPTFPNDKGVVFGDPLLRFTKLLQRWSPVELGESGFHPPSFRWPPRRRRSGAAVGGSDAGTYREFIVIFFFSRSCLHLCGSTWSSGPF